MLDLTTIKIRQRDEQVLKMERRIRDTAGGGRRVPSPGDTPNQPRPRKVAAEAVRYHRAGRAGGGVSANFPQNGEWRRAVTIDANT
jgi:hypothetical protein